MIAPEASLVASKLPSRLNAACLAGPLAGQTDASEALIRGPEVAASGPELPQAASGRNTAAITIERHIEKLLPLQELSGTVLLIQYSKKLSCRLRL